MSEDKFRLDDLMGTGKIARFLSLGHKAVLEQLIESDPLVRAVANGETTYATEVQFIVDKYDTFRKRVLPPVVDEEFDEHVREVLSSMNQLLSSEARVYVNKYKTQERRNEIKYGIVMHAAAGVAWGMVVSGGIYLMSMASSHPSKMYAFVISSLIGFPALFSGLGVYNKDNDTKQALTHLQHAAKRADKYIEEYKQLQQSE